MLKMCSPIVPAFSSRAASSDTLKKYLSVGLLAIALISLIKFLVSRAFLFKYPRTLKREAEEKRSLLPLCFISRLALGAVSGEAPRPQDGRSASRAATARASPFRAGAGSRREGQPREQMLESNACPSLKDNEKNVHLRRCQTSGCCRRYTERSRLSTWSRRAILRPSRPP